MNLPTVSKRPFGHPVPVSVIEHFCHPWKQHRYHVPAFGRDGRLYASNGWLAIRFLCFGPPEGPGPYEVVDRLLKQRWHNSRDEDPKKWRRMDDCTLDIFAGGVLPQWDEKTGKYFILEHAQVDWGKHVPLAALQLISRLPRCEVYVCNSRGTPLAFRFNGGDGLIASFTPEQENEWYAAGHQPVKFFPSKWKP